MKNLNFIVMLLLAWIKVASTNKMIFRSFRPTLKRGIDVTDSRGLMKKYREVSDFDQASKAYFNEYANHFYNQSPTECLKLLERYDVNFGIRFLRDYCSRREIVISESDMGPNELFLEYLFKMISFHLISISFKKTQFKVDFEAVVFLIGLAKKKISLFKFHEDKNDKYKDFEQKLTIFKFIVNSISVDFDNEINYNSLFRTLSEIKAIVKTKNLSNELTNFHFSKYISLFWCYIRCLWLKDAMKIFELEHHSKPIAIYLVLELWHEIHLQVGEIYPPKLENIFIELYKNGSLNSDPLVALLKKNPPAAYCKYFKVPMNPSSYKEISRFSEKDCSDGFYPMLLKRILLQIKAATILEQYLSQNLLIKVDYPPSQYFPKIKDSIPEGPLNLCAII
jgi:hypothetical protein